MTARVRPSWLEIRSSSKGALRTSSTATTRRSSATARSSSSTTRSRCLLPRISRAPSPASFSASFCARQPAATSRVPGLCRRARCSAWRLFCSPAAVTTQVTTTLTSAGSPDATRR